MTQEHPTRSRAQKLSDDEKATLRRLFNRHTRTAAAAAVLNCSQRIVAKYYASFRGRAPGDSKTVRKIEPSPRRAPAHKNLYVSSFEPS